MKDFKSTCTEPFLTGLFKIQSEKKISSRTEQNNVFDAISLILSSICSEI